jgi:hypothetical protein
MADWNPFKKKDEPVPDPKTPTDNEALLAKMGELLNPFKESIDNFKKEVGERFAAVEEGIKPKPAPVTPTERASVFDNEDAAFAERMGPLVVSQVELKARVLERDVFDEYKDWADLLPKVRKILDETPIQTKAAPNYESYIRNVFNMLIGSEARENGLRRNGTRFVLEDGASSNRTTDSPEAQADKAFLDYHITTSKGKVVTRRDFLTRMGIDVTTPEGIKKAKESFSQLQVVN